MIPSSYPFWLNAVAFISITLPIVLLFFIYRMSSFKVWKYLLCGVLGFLLIDRLLAPFFYAFTETLAIGIDGDNSVFFRYIAPLFYGTFEFAGLFIMLRFILRKNLKVTEAVALPVMYYIFPIIEGAVSFPSLAKCAKASINGTLGELVTETLTMEDLTGYIEMMKAPEFWPSVFGQILNRYVIMLVLGVAVILIYHGMMKQKPINYLFAFLVIVGNYELISLVEQFLGLNALNIFLAVVFAGLTFFFVKYFIWYFKQKAEFKQQLADYKEHLKRK